MIRVGRCVFVNGKEVDPSYPGFEPIVVMTKSSKYGAIGPYCLKDDKGRNMENIWQFHKVYETVPPSIQKYSKYDQRVIWNHPGETHVIFNDDNTWSLTPEYFRWREKGMNAPDPIRYPVGYNWRHKCLFSLRSVDGVIDPNPLDYIEARKQIYLPLYVHLVKDHPQFKFLLEKVRRGENILIIEVDGPHQESLSYYQEKYNVNSDFIDQGTMLCNRNNLNIMLNDSKHPFGHGYCLALALLMELQ